MTQCMFKFSMRLFTLNVSIQSLCIFRENFNPITCHQGNWKSVPEQGCILINCKLKKLPPGTSQQVPCYSKVRYTTVTVSSTGPALNNPKVLGIYSRVHLRQLPSIGYSNLHYNGSVAVCVVKQIATCTEVPGLGNGFGKLTPKALLIIHPPLKEHHTVTNRKLQITRPLFELVRTTTHGEMLTCVIQVCGEEMSIASGISCACANYSCS